MAKIKMTLCTGYRRMPGKLAEGIEEYEAAAARIRRDNTRPYEERQKEVEKLLMEFCKLNGGND